MNLLFICKHNRFRSKVAEAIFNKLNKNKSINFRSAGTNIAKRRYTEPSVKLILKLKGYKIKNDKPTKINKRLINWADKIVIVANNVPLSKFPKSKTEVWKVRDTTADNLKEISLIINEIEIRVKKLVVKLKKLKNTKR